MKIQTEMESVAKSIGTCLGLFITADYVCANIIFLTDSSVAIITI